MVSIMKEKETPEQSAPVVESQDASTPEPRFPKAAVRYIDALLRIQRAKFERELSARSVHLSRLHSAVQPPRAVDLLAESDAFVGTGWSDLGRRRDGTAFRWMGRIGTVLLPVDLTAGGTVTIEGAGFSRRRHLKTLSFWMENQPVEGTLKRKGFNRWVFHGKIGALPPQPFSILRLQSAGQSRLAVGVDSFVSVAISRIRVEADRPD